MAEKEVQNSKNSSVSATSGGKKTPVSGSNRASGPSSTVSSKETSKEAVPVREMLELLRVMNTNMVQQSEKMNDMALQFSETTKQLAQPPHYDDYSSSQCEDIDYDDYDYGQSGDNPSVCTDGDDSLNTELLPKSIYKHLSDKFNQTEQVEEGVHPDLAMLVNNSFRNGLSDEKYEEISRQIFRPENCDSLVKTRVNQGIWRLLKSWTQSDDTKLSSLQGVLVKASINIVKLVGKLGISESEHLELGTTAIALLGHANKLINMKRKDLHKSDLDSKYHFLASASLPYTNLLYGDDTDVNNNVREINTLNRIGKTVGRGGGPIRGYSRGRRFRGSPYGARGFRGRGRGVQPRCETITAPKNQKMQRKQ